MIIFDDIQIRFLLVIIRNLITVDDITRSIHLDCFLERKIAKFFVIMQEYTIIPRTVFAADIHISFLIHDSL